MQQVQAASCTSTAACTFSIPSPPSSPETEKLDPAVLSSEWDQGMGCTCVRIL